MARYVRGHKPEGNALGQCINCFEPIEIVDTGARWLVPGDRPPEITYYRHSRRPRPQTDRERTHCSKCGKKGEWYEFKPGSGECTECQT